MYSDVAEHRFNAKAVLPGRGKAQRGDKFNHRGTETRNKRDKMQSRAFAGHSRWIGRRRVRGPGLQGAASASCRPGPGRVGPLTGRVANVVIMTFITGEFSGGPWTSAVQGRKYLKYL